MFLSESNAPTIISNTFIILLVCLLAAVAPGLAVVVGVSYFLWRHSGVAGQRRHERQRRQTWGF